jgi:signal recognition particle subunit SRP19
MDPTGFFCIYPSYVDSAKTMKQGRRIGVEKAVDTPTVQDLSEALASLNIRHATQPHKGYSRDQTTLWDNPGRVRVDPAILEGGLYTKRSLMVELASIVTELPSRIRRREVEAAVAKAKEAKRLQEQEAKKAQAALQHKQKSQTKGSSSRSNKKKGKKKR